MGRRSLFSRTIGLVWRNPSTLPAFLRFEYRRRWGSNWDRRRHPEHSALPSYISISPTRRCNLRCSMCVQYRREGDRPEDLNWYDPDQELPLNAWINLLDQLADWRPVIFITGGEPLLYPHILELVAAAKERHLIVHLQSNGVLLERVAEVVVDLGLEMVSVSIDGPPAVHDTIRGQGTFQRSVAGIRALMTARQKRKAPGPLVDIPCTISRDNLTHLPEMVPLALELGIDKLRFIHTLFMTPEMVARHNACLSPEFAQTQGIAMIHPSIPEGEYYQSLIGPADLPVLINSLKEVKRRSRSRIPMEVTPDVSEAEIGPYYLDLDHPFPQVCRNLWQKARILPDGSVSPCLHVVMGNITVDPLQKIWHSSPYRNFRRLVAKKLFPGCARCCNRGFS